METIIQGRAGRLITEVLRTDKKTSKSLPALLFSKENMKTKEFNPDHLLTDENLIWVLVDFDKVIHQRDENDPTYAIKNRPVKGVKRALMRLKKEGFKIVVYTARSWEEYIAIKKWLKYWKIPHDKIICGKVLGVIYIDDRGYRFEDWKKDLPKILKILKRKEVKK